MQARISGRRTPRCDRQIECLRANRSRGLPGGYRVEHPLKPSWREFGIEITVDAEPLTIAADHAVPLGLMVNELATNSINYAFPKSAGRIILASRGATARSP